MAARKSRAKTPGHPQKRGRKAGNAESRNGIKLPVTAPGPLTPRGQSGPQANAEAVEQMTAAQRRAKAAELKVYQRLSCQQIADVMLQKYGLKTTAKTISLDLIRVYREWNDQAIKIIAHGQAQEAQRLDQNDRSLIPIASGQFPQDTQVIGTGKKRQLVTVPIRAATGVKLKLDALEQLRRNSESRRKLFGWDAEKDTERRYTDEQFLGLARALMAGLMDAFSEAEHRERIIRVMSEISQKLRTTTIDVSALPDDAPALEEHVG